MISNISVAGNQGLGAVAPLYMQQHEAAQQRGRRSSPASSLTSMKGAGWRPSKCSMAT